MTPRHVAVLGAGITGCSVALLLARRGIRVSLFDRAPRPFEGASRWNEGKIHLGFLYGADPGLGTARRVLPGGLAFRPMVERLVGTSLAPAVTRDDDIYLVHRDSVVGASAMGRYFETVAALAAAHPDRDGYLRPLGAARSAPLAPAELARLADPAEIVAGFRVPERSVSTNWVADRFVAAIAAGPRIEMRMGTAVLGLRGAPEGPARVVTPAGEDGPYDAVVNALWEGRLALDLGLGLPPPAEWSHRYRLSVFLRGATAPTVPSAVVAVGPYGDVKNYGDGSFYLSWYPAGLMVQGSGASPPALPPLPPERRARVAEATLAQLSALLPPVAALRSGYAERRVEGGWVYAAASGALDDPAASVHRRDRIGIARRGAYLSVDTGKYSVGPWLAAEVVALICGD